MLIFDCTSNPHVVQGATIIALFCSYFLLLLSPQLYLYKYTSFLMTGACLFLSLIVLSVIQFHILQNNNSGSHYLMIDESSTLSSHYFIFRFLVLFKGWVIYI